MTKKIFSYIMIVAASALTFVSCKDDVTVLFNSKVDASKAGFNSRLVNLKYSVDGGTTFTDFPIITNGQKVMIKLYDTNSEVDLTPDKYDFDWSASKPSPTDATSDIAEFTFTNSNSIAVTVVNHHCPYDASSWTGAWGGDEVGACCGGTDANNITQDPSNPNKFIMDNFWGDGVPAYFILTPSTSAYDQVLTMPEQETADPGVSLASGTGTYDQCAGTFTIATTYVAFGGTYKWQYNFHR